MQKPSEGIYYYTNWVNFGVGYPLLWNDHPEQGWVKVGATVEHGNTNSANHWMAECAAYGIYYTTIDYKAAHPEQTQIGMNDMSLSFGGKFDLKENGYSRWQNSVYHVSHNWGSAADIRNNGEAYSIPPENGYDFAGVCALKGAMEALVRDPNTSNQHIHCRWPTNVYGIYPEGCPEIPQ
jgi:hypothetical protein